MRAPQRLASNPARAGLAVCFALLVALYLLTSPDTWGDTQVYVGSVLEAIRTGAVAPLLEFGHLLWRPLGYAVYQLIPSAWFGSESQLIAYVAFLLPSLAAGFLCAGLFYLIARTATSSFWIATVTAAMFLCANAFLRWSQTGSSYIPGLAFLSLAVWLLLNPLTSGRGVTSRTLILAGASLAISILFWLPYITVSAGVASLLWFWSPAPLRQRIRWTVLFSAVTLVVVFAAYLAAIALQGLWSVAEIAAWIREASHGIQPAAAFTRFVFALPRSFIDMGQDGMLFKRYLLHDPYAGVSLGELIGTSLVRLALFYAFMAWVLFTLFREPEGRRILLTLTIAAAPLLFFALFLFDSSPTERYLPLYPFLIPAIALTVGSSRPPLFGAMLAGLLVLVAVSNLWSASDWRTRDRDNRIAAALAKMKSKVDRQGIVWVPVIADPALAFTVSRPFHEVNRPDRLPVRPLVFTGSSWALAWRDQFVRLTLESLRKGGSVWISNRLFAERPQRDWNWTEGDVPGVSWTSLTRFFNAFTFSSAPGDPDTFRQLDPTPANLEILTRIESTLPPPAADPHINAGSEAR